MYNNKKLSNLLVTKQELPKYQADQNPAYKIDSSKKINKNMFAKVDFLVDKILSCPRLKLSNSQPLIWDNVKTWLFLSNFAEQLRRKTADVPEIYFTLLDAAGITPTLVLNQSAKPNRGEAGSLSKSKPQNLQRLYTQSAAAFGSVRNLSKASNLSVSKLSQFSNQRLRTQTFFWRHENSRKWRLLLGSKMNFVVRIFFFW